MAVEPTLSTGEARRAPLAVRATAWLLGIAVALAVAEIAARFYFPLPDVRNFNRIAYSPLEVSGGMRERPDMGHTSYWYASAPDHARSVHHLNLNGFRDRDWNVATKHGRRVLFVGDSFVEGFMAADDQSIPRVYERLARGAGADVEVWNLGIGAAGLPEYVSVIQDAVPALHPDEIVLVFYANDFLALEPFSEKLVKAPFVPEHPSRWYPRLLGVVRQLIAHQPVARAGYREPFPFLAAVPDPSNPWTANDAQFSAHVEPAIADAMRKGLFNPFNVDEAKVFARLLPATVDVGGYLRFLKQFLDAQGVALRLAYIPYPLQVSDYYRAFAAQYSSHDAPSLVAPEFQVHAALVAREAAQLGIPFLDLTPVLRAEEARGNHLYWDYDEHMRPEGYARVARALLAPPQN